MSYIYHNLSLDTTPSALDMILLQLLVHSLLLAMTDRSRQARAFLNDGNPFSVVTAPPTHSNVQQVQVVDPTFHFPRGVWPFTIIRHDFILLCLDHNSTSTSSHHQNSPTHLERISHVQPSWLLVLSALQLSCTQHSILRYFIIPRWAFRHYGFLPKCRAEDQSKANTDHESPWWVWRWENSSCFCQGELTYHTD